MNANVLKKALATDGAHSFSDPLEHGFHEKLNPSTEAKKKKMISENPPMNTARYLYSVVRKDSAPVK